MSYIDSVKLISNALLVSLLLLVSGCGSSDGTAPGEDLSSADITAASNTFTAPSLVYQQGAAAIQTGVEGGFGASLLAGSTTLVTTGSLIQQADNSWQYQPTPTDRLSIISRTGEPLDLFFTAFSGDFSSDAQHFLRRDHNLAFRATSPGNATDIEIRSNSSNGLRTATLDGVLEDEGKIYTIDAEVSGTYYFEVDNTGSELRIDDVLSGTVNVNNTEITLQETWFYNSVYSSSARQEVSNAIRTFQNTWRQDGTEYQFRNGRVQTEFKDGKPNNWQDPGRYWEISGQLLQNGAAIGQLEMSSDNSFIKGWLVIGDNRTELQSWQNF